MQVRRPSNHIAEIASLECHRNAKEKLGRRIRPSLSFSVAPKLFVRGTPAALATALLPGLSLAGLSLLTAALALTALALAALPALLTGALAALAALALSALARLHALARLALLARTVHVFIRHGMFLESCVESPRGVKTGSPRNRS